MAIYSVSAIIYIILHVCVCVSVTEGQRKRFDLQAHDAISLATER